jgi:hypothetical protein
LFCKSEVADFVNENFSCFLANVNKAEAFDFAQKLGITGATQRHKAMMPPAPTACISLVCVCAFHPQRILGSASYTNRRPPRQSMFCSGRKAQQVWRVACEV